ncbi:unnamed protein product [Mytilus edulis]|uniref:Thioredoxin domain-containing protein n=1 Tax=Mytilus edulis TaxID=6550 RepID=A0A8S3VGX7_MYTED|nr:unnamed protein product [Mytilus edulis]
MCLVLDHHDCCRDQLSNTRCASYSITMLAVVELKIIEVSGSNLLRKLQNDGKFLIIYVTNGCHECNLAYSKFVAASQPFDREEIRFGRIQHTGLAATLEIDTFPSLIYFKANSYQVNSHNMVYPTKEYKNIETEINSQYTGKIDITVDSIIQLISDVTKRDFIYMDKHYTVEVNKANFDDTLNTPRQCKLLLLYTNENKDKVEWFDDLAELFKNDDKIMFARLDVHRDGELKDRFKARAFPALYWYSDDEIPRKSMYGGRFDKIEIMAFIADKTGITRQHNGALPEGIKMISKLSMNILRVSVTNLAVTSMIKSIAKGPRQRELLLKKQNVVRQFFDIMGDKLLKRKSQTVTYSQSQRTAST